MLSIQFRTAAFNGLLLYNAASRASDVFISVEVQRGHLLVRMNDGGGAQLLRSK